jgi:uncharacterized protein YceH (UPF0502 family)
MARSRAPPGPAGSRRLGLHPGPGNRRAPYEVVGDFPDSAGHASRSCRLSLTQGSPDIRVRQPADRRRATGASSLENRLTGRCRLTEPLDETEIRVLGALLEKARTTPDNYPLSLNALTAACNQASNREPVMSLAETEVSAALDRLRRRSLVRAIVRSGAGVTKYMHLMDEAMGLVNRQLAVLGVLMLRGPQTSGELRTRTQRLHEYDDVADVEAALEGLASREPPLVLRLPRRPGQREERWAHLLAGADAAQAAGASDGPAATEPRAPVAADDDRVTKLEAELASLRQEVADLRGELAAFRRQFE